MARYIALLACLLCAGVAFAREAPPAAADPALEQRMQALSGTLRCLVCQNQTLADSDAALAVDLRNEIRRKMRAGMTDAQIRDYLVARYGDFVLYRPPFKASTLLLWVGPFVLLAGGLGALAFSLRRRQGHAAGPEPERAALSRALLNANEGEADP